MSATPRLHDGRGAKYLMKRLHRLIMTVMLLATAASVGNAKAEPPPVIGSEEKMPLSRAASQDVETLLRTGFLKDYLLGDESNLLTRRTLAAALARLIRDVQRNPTAFDKPSEQHWRLLTAAYNVAWELGPELRQNGIEPLTPYRMFPATIVPTDHWAYQAVDTLQNARIDISYSGRHRLLMSRLGFADATLRLMNDIERTPPENRHYLPRLVREFDKELRLLGADTADLKARAEIYRFGPPFPDVPARHWASPAVETVRRAGILKGYTGGTFHPEAKK